MYCQQKKLYFLRDDDVCLVLDQHAEVDFYSVNSLKQQTTCRNDASLVHILILSRPVCALISCYVITLSGEAANAIESCLIQTFKSYTTMIRPYESYRTTLISWV